MIDIVIQGRGAGDILDEDRNGCDCDERPDYARVQRHLHQVERKALLGIHKVQVRRYVAGRHGYLLEVYPRCTLSKSMLLMRRDRPCRTIKIRVSRRPQCP